MAEFKRTVDEVALLESQLASWEAAAELGSGDAATFAQARTQYADSLARVDKYKLKADEPDPDKRIYGAGMTQKIIELHRRAAALSPRMEQLAGRFAGVIDAAHTQEAERAAAAARAEAEEAALLRAARAQAEEQAAAAVAAAKAAEELRVAEVRAAAERLRVLQVGKAHAKEAAAAAAAESLRRAKVAAEASATAAREAAAAKERDDKRKRVELLVAAKTAGGAGALPTGGSGSTPPSLKFGTERRITSAAELRSLLGASREAVVVVDYMAPWCGPCRAMAPAFAQMAIALRDVAFLQVDCDALPDAAAAAGIRAFPTLHVYFRGKLLAGFSGADMRRLRAEVDAARAVAEEALTTEAIAASLAAEEEGAGSAPAAAPAPARSVAAPLSLPTAPVDDAELERVELAAALAMSIDGEPAAKTLAAAAAAYAATQHASAFREKLAALRGFLSEADFASLRGVLEQYLGNIATHPGDSSFVRIKRGNPQFQSRVARHGAASEGLLADAGFVEEAGGAFLVHPSAPSDAPGATPARCQLEACLGVLREAPLPAAAAAAGAVGTVPAVSSGAQPPPPAEEDDEELAAALRLSVEEDAKAAQGGW